MAGLAILEAVLAGVLLSVSLATLYQSSYSSSLHYSKSAIEQHNAMFDIGALIYGNSTAGMCIRNSACGTSLLASINRHYSLSYSSVGTGNASIKSGSLTTCTRSSFECLPALNTSIYCIYVCS